MTDTREAVRIAVGGVLANASNYPEKVQARILGQDMAPLTERVTEAVLGALAAADFDRWPASVKEEAWYDGWEARADLGVQAACPDDHNPYRGNSLEANPDPSTKETT